MRYYLDTEFNGFGGELISLALAPADPSLAEFYAVVPCLAPIDPWVAKHVMPNLRQAQEPQALAGARLASFLWNATEREAPIIVADWPTDFEHLLALLITGLGTMHPVPDFGMEFKRLPGFNTADHSAVPHNALEDARALRNHVEGK